MRQVLAKNPTLRLLAQVFGDPRPHRRILLRLAFGLVMQTNDVEAEAAFDRLWRGFPRLHRHQRPLEFGHGLSQTDLSQMTASLFGWAVRPLCRQLGEIRPFGQPGDDVHRLGSRRGPRRRIIRRSYAQDMGSLEQIAAAEALPMGLEKLLATGFVRFRDVPEGLS